MKHLLNIMLAAGAMLCCSCNETFIAPTLPTGNGKLAFSNFTINQEDVQVDVTTKAASEAPGTYVIEIFNDNDESVFTGTYAQVKATGYGVELPAGSYYMTAKSSELPYSTFETRVFGARESFTITAGQTTELKGVTCTIQQCAATVSYSEDLVAMMTGNGSATVEVTAGYPLTYDVTYSAQGVSYDKRAGYFAVPDASSTMVVTFSGLINGKQQKMTKQLANVKVGELHQISFIKKVDPEGNVTFDVIVNSYVQDADLNSAFQASLLNPIGDDPDAPKGDGGIKLEFASDCTQFTDLGNIVVPANGQAFDLRLVATVPNGVKSLKAYIESTSKGFMDAVIAAGGPTIDLVNPSPESTIIFEVVPFPHGPELVGQTTVNFNLSSAQEPINLFPGEHSFTMKVTDQKGCKKDVTIKMIVLQ